MATKSILKNVEIKTQNDCLALVNALENAKNKISQEVVMKKSYSVATKEDILKLKI